MMIIPIIYVVALVQIGLGFVQPIIAISRISEIKRNDSSEAIGLKRYLLLVALYLIVFFTIKMPNYFSVYVIFYFIIPWAFAIWFTLFTRKHRKKNENVVAYDEEQFINTAKMTKEYNRVSLAAH